MHKRVQYLWNPRVREYWCLTACGSVVSKDAGFHWKQVKCEQCLWHMHHNTPITQLRWTEEQARDKGLSLSALR